MKTLFRKQKMNKVLAVVLAALMCMGMIPMTLFVGADPAQTSAQQILTDGIIHYYDEDGNEVDDDSWVATTKKTISGTDIENEFDITLEVKTTEDLEEFEISPDTAVVLTIDVSASMANDANGNSQNVAAADKRMNIAKAAAKDFIDSYAASANNAHRYLSIVVFGLNAKVIQSWTDVSVAANLTAAKGQIDRIKDNSTSETGKYQLENGTFIQGGLLVSRNLYNKATFAAQAVNTENRFVVLLSDGNPNCWTTTTTTDTSNNR